ncbi:hypothetical protein DH2020_015419 [Rehmannia glutinosa]|uniref:Uncharacterized protein n=1 Tax=Rehmannia glutinosa TaxID=99300 RepID=A0ABR0WSQ3_REHGL
MSLRLGFVPTIVVSSPAGAELVLKTHDLVFASRSTHQASKYISYDQRNIVFAPYGPYWRNMRKLCTLELLSNLKINQFQPMRRAEMEIFVDSLRRAAEKREIVDLSARVSGLSGDMTCLMVFGRKYADRDLDEKGFKAVIQETMQVAAVPNLGDFFPFMGVLDLQGLTRRMKKLSKTFDGFLERIIDDHVQNKQEKKQTQDFVDTMMSIMESGEAGFEFDRRHVKAVLLDMLIGGTDTSAASVEWALTELIRHPRCLKKLQKELEQVVGLDQNVKESHLDKLEYLDLVLKETLESTGRPIINPRIYGRLFIGSNIDLRGHDFQLIPFGSGEEAAGHAVRADDGPLAVAQLVHCFDWELPDGMSLSDLDMEEHFGLVTGREKHLLAIPTYRLHK